MAGVQGWEGESRIHAIGFERMRNEWQECSASICATFPSDRQVPQISGAVRFHRPRRLHLRLGARLDIEPETRSHLVLGVQGTAPYWLHVDLAGFLSNQGDLTGRIEVEYDQKITQQLILQPRIEAEISVQDIAEREIGAGLYKIEPGLRLRYEFVPEFAPYIGIDYEAKLGESADLARADGEDADGFKFLIGLRAWF